MMEKIEWERLKTEFNAINDYSERLKWWDENVPKIEFLPLSVYIHFHQNIVDKIDTSSNKNILAEWDDKKYYDKGNDDFISIQPRFKFKHEKELFWNWLVEKENLNEYSKLFEDEYNKLFENVHSVFIDEIIKEEQIKLERAIKYDCENSKIFKSSYNSCIRNKIPNILFGQYDKSKKPFAVEMQIWSLIYGYLMVQKEITFQNCVNKIKNKNVDEKVPEGIENKNAMQPIGLLYELGVLDFLKDTYKLSPEKISALLYSITNNKATTASGYIKHVEGVKNDKNNPFNSEQNRNFYKQVFANIGIEPIKKGKPDEERER